MPVIAEALAVLQEIVDRRGPEKRLQDIVLHDGQACPWLSLVLVFAFCWGTPPTGFLQNSPWASGYVVLHPRVRRYAMCLSMSAGKTY